jgi:hypothetical protein
MDYRTAKELLRATRSTLKQLEEQLEFFERQRERKYAEYFETGGDNQLFWYRSDDFGRIQLQSDAAFVVEQLFCFPQVTNDVFSTQPTSWRFSMVDLSAARDLTHIVNRVPNASDEALPLEVLSPSTVRGGVFSGDLLGDQNDYWAFLVDQYLLPRSAVLEFRVSNPASGGESLLPQFVLGGFKKF